MFEDIKKQFREVIIHSQNIPDPEVDDLFNRWETNKKRFIDRFGGLIYEFPIPVEFVMSPADRVNRAKDFANNLFEVFRCSELADFIDENAESFFDNKVVQEHGKKIPKGMKLIKAFKYFIDYEPSLKKIQDWASQIMQEKEIKGILCFSVHPLDFLSSSENTHGWRTCHSLDGEYRTGNLSYMTDDCTFVVYLKAPEEKILGAFGENVPWNSKKWRVLFHASNDDNLLFAGKQYPFSTKNGLDIALHAYNSFFNSYSYYTWSSDYVDSYTSNCSGEFKYLNYKYMVYRNELIPLNKVVVEGPMSLNYNDILYSSSYKYPYYAILNTSDHFYRASAAVSYLLEHPITMGHSVNCLHCGKNLIHNAESMRCVECEEQYGTENYDSYGYCSCCDRRIYLEDGISMGSSDTIICKDCLETQAFVCENCGEVFYNNQKRIDEDGHWICKYCYEEE